MGHRKGTERHRKAPKGTVWHQKRPLFDHESTQRFGQGLEFRVLGQLEVRAAVREGRGCERQVGAAAPALDVRGDA